ncbi:MAG: CoA transferase [Acidobacteriia bacterium]|nr:CoA transferase [Terriglobia bacterium]
MTSPRPKPLSHIRVLDLSRLLPGPVATLHLADLGADVIRIEPVGDEEPAHGAHVRARPGPRTLLHLMLNRNKRALRIDLTRTAGREIFLRLAKEADVVVEGFRPGVVDRLGIGYELVRAINPRVVYCSISGYGQNGPNRLRAGHDINYMAWAGVGDQIGTSGGPPAIPNLQIGDLLGGSLTSVMGILAGLVDAKARGKGRYVDVAMTDSLMAHSVLALSAMTASGRTAPRGEDMLSGGLPCYSYYSTGDGRYLAVGALEAKFWERLCDALERPDLKPKHLVHGEAARRVRDELQTIFGGQSSGHWMKVFRDVDCCVTLVLTLEEAMESEQARAREMVVETECPGIGKLVEFRPPLKMSDFDFEPDSPCSRGRTETEEILGAAGYSAGEIDGFRAARIVG